MRHGLAFGYWALAATIATGCGGKSNDAEKTASTDDPRPGHADAGGSVGAGGRDGADSTGGGQPSRTPPSIPPFTLGTPGWRESTEPFCSGKFGPSHETRVWSDDEGVFVLSRSSACAFSDTGECVGVGSAVYVNRGNGWGPIHEDIQQFGYTELSGFPGGPLVLLGGACAVSAMSRHGQPACLLIRGTTGGGSAIAVSTRSSDRGVALLDDGQVMELTTTGAKHLATLSPAEHQVWNALSATTDWVFAAGTYGRMARLGADGSVVDLSDVPRGDYTRVWAFADDDVWASGIGLGLVHFDGTRWERVPQPEGREDVLHFWGSPSRTLFYLGTHSFGRVKDGTVEVLAALEHVGEDLLGSTRFTSLWGNSDTEVFLGLQDTEPATTDCGGATVVFFDGKELHPF